MGIGQDNFRAISTAPGPVDPGTGAAPQAAAKSLDLADAAGGDAARGVLTRPQNGHVASGKHTKNDRKSPFLMGKTVKLWKFTMLLMGKSTITGSLSIAMLTYQRVTGNINVEFMWNNMESQFTANCLFATFR